LGKEETALNTLSTKKPQTKDLRLFRCELSKVALLPLILSTLRLRYSPSVTKKDDKPKNKKRGDDPSESRPEQCSGKAWEWWGAKNHWVSKEEALKGIPQQEQDVYFRNCDDCWRCGWAGHITFECFSFSTLQGTTLPKASWKAAGASEGKRKRDEEVEEHPAAKQQKVAAAEIMDTDTFAPLWEDSESDF